MASPSSLHPVPQSFSRVKNVLEGVADVPHVSVSAIRAPSKLAPFATAIGAEVHADASFQRVSGEEIDELATGRVVVLHDPAAPDEWQGDFRIVSYIRAELEHDMGNEALLGAVAWSWLTDALESHDCDVRAAGGTTTRVLSESFGTLAARPSTIDLELRASWTPVLDEPEDITDHFDAWVDLLTTIAGLPPLPAGVTALPGRRR
ncbi:MAG: DUF3000 domain-containing protein [Brevibacterium yomogidense]|uniref:Uncharacterized protein Q1 colocalized with Q n=1 Tax=Brevibacterium yomogidense TaxID=946573 RepID=A0A1X6XF19_9MICO|nr:MULTISPECIES: DUF3000 domain-containing protein [Brevibacterium]SLM97669.1 Uncharacterized protein Q1 colocalized with Q [Brevibacterium yomogidense]